MVCFGLVNGLPFTMLGVVGGRLRPSSLRKSSFSSNSSINNACPPPPPTPHQIQSTAGSSSSTSSQLQKHHQQHSHPHPHPHQQHQQHQHRRSSNSSHIGNSSLATKPAINLLGNQLQVNYFEFPPTTRSVSSLLASRYTGNATTNATATASTPSLNCTPCSGGNCNSPTATAAANSSYSSAVAKAAASTACALLATCHVASNTHNTTSTSHRYPQQQQKEQEQEQAHHQTSDRDRDRDRDRERDSMGRREIKRSNTSGSTSRSYDSGSATTNFVGKFTQSVRRIVQDVKDEGAPSGMTRDEVIETNERLRSLRLRLEESYDTVKKALINLMNKYGDSKSHRNIFQRYPMLKLMIKEVIRLETQYWTLVDIPRQEKQETVPSYVMRACSIMEKTQKSGEGVKTSARLAEEAAERRERMERLEHMTTAQIELENTQLINDLYRLLKKYLGLRHLIRVLKEEYGSSKMYPIFPRYTMLKDMIKGIMHDPDYMEVCHETLANSN
ncbi:probable basic-leucine zipper transcription factor R [Drosophila grimshawi]|nr:probable basic-leucine zipper transcription factor R [Drosophila grimshawi]